MSGGSGIGIDSTARNRLPLKLPCPFHTIPRQQAVNTFGKPLQVVSTVVFPHPVKFDNAWLQLFELRIFDNKGIPHDNFWDSERQTGGD